LSRYWVRTAEERAWSEQTTGCAIHYDADGASVSVRAHRDARYLEMITSAVRVCAKYRPKMGRRGRAGLSPQDFQEIYGGDPFYKWFGLDNPLLYTAHRAAGGMTSIYRQIGIACEHLFRALLQDELGLSEEDTKWSYSVVGADERRRSLSLDARVSLEKIPDAHKRKRVRAWLRGAAGAVGVDTGVIRALRGAVFELRQGYKSKDSKRQNADIANAAAAYSQGYLPCLLLMSCQIDEDVKVRYQRARWAILVGQTSGSSLESTYGFLREVVGYDLAAFFERHAPNIRREVLGVLQALLKRD